MRGRKPKPASQQQREGDPRKRGKRKLAARVRIEAAGTTGIPDCPDYLKGRARWLWNFLRSELESFECARRVDTPLLIGLCQLFQVATEKQSTKAWATFKSMATEFPMSPAARARLLNAPPKNLEVDLMKLLSQPRAKQVPLPVQ